MLSNPVLWAATATISVHCRLEITNMPPLHGAPADQLGPSAGGGVSSSTASVEFAYQCGHDLCLVLLGAGARALRSFDDRPGPWWEDHVTMSPRIHLFLGLPRPYRRHAPWHPIHEEDAEGPDRLAAQRANLFRQQFFGR